MVYISQVIILDDWELHSLIIWLLWTIFLHSVMYVRNWNMKRKEQYKMLFNVVFYFRYFDHRTQILFPFHPRTMIIYIPGPSSSFLFALQWFFLPKWIMFWCKNLLWFTQMIASLINLYINIIHIYYSVFSFFIHLFM